MAAQSGSSMEKPGEDSPDRGLDRRNQDLLSLGPNDPHRVMNMLKQLQQRQQQQQQHHPNIQPPPNSHLPPPFVKQNGPLPFRESPMNEPSFGGIPIGRGPPQSAFPMAPGPPQKIWLLEKEIIQKAQAAQAGSPPTAPSRPPVFMPMGAGPPPDQAILSSSPQASQASRVWQHLFPNARVGAQSGPGGPEHLPSQGEPVKPADLGNMGLRQILGRVVDVTELEGVMGINQPSVRPPPGFENMTKPQAPEPQSWILKKGGGGALPPLSVAGSPQHGVSLLSKWKSPSLDQPLTGPKTPPLPAELAGGGFGGAVMPGASSPVVGAHRPPQSSGFSLFNHEAPKGSATRENFQGFWDNFTDVFSRNQARKGSGSSYPESSVIEASQRLELLDLREDYRNSDDTLGPDQAEMEKKKNKRRKRSKKRAKKSSESGETLETPPQETEKPASLVESNTPSTPNGEKAPDRKRPRRKSRGKKAKADPGAFEDFLDIDSVMAGLKDSSLIKGEIRINAKNYKECYINDPDNKKDILISGTLDRNRALEGDIVVVQLKDEEDQPQNVPASGAQKSAKVVYILEKVHSRVCVGYLTKIGEKDYATLCPRDSRIPRLLIPLTTLPVQILQNPSAYDNILFKAKIVSWETPNFAQGIIVEELGQKGNVQVETLAILKELDLDGDPVPEELSRYLPNSYSITQEEIEKRLDLRKECIFTIDPETARDLDDAVSIKKLAEDLYEVGVHISDVSQFLELGTPLDVKVSERATTIYLVDKAIHMLPLELCLQCSLLPGQDKFAVSVIWQMDSKGNILDTKFARTVIHSCTKLSYEHAQAIIEGRDVELPTLYNNITPEMIRESILELYKISLHMTKRRFDGGALRIDQPKVCFRVNEKVVPTEASLYEIKDSNRLIEEFMLRANQSVAEYIHSMHPTIALLRRHAPPKAEMMSKLQQSLGTLGIEMNIATAGEIHRCIVENSANDRAKGIVLSTLCAKPMTRAEYFCNEPDSHHYALNIDMYTHFTSPIRRYCDIVVHRVLCAILGFNDLPPWDTYDVKQFCRTSNKKKNAAKKAGEMSCELFTALYVRELGGMQVEGIVQNVISHALDIIVVPLALSTRVYLDRLPAKLEYVENSFNSSLTITWNHAPSLPQTYRLFSTVPVTLRTQETHLSIDTQLVPPVPLPAKTEPPTN